MNTQVQCARPSHHMTPSHSDHTQPNLIYFELDIESVAVKLEQQGKCLDLTGDLGLNLHAS